MEFNRRDFVKAAAVSLAAAPATASSAEQPAAPANVPTSEQVFNAIQVGPYTLLDEGIEHALDLMQSTAATNALFLYSHTYNGDFRKAVPTLADDHGVAPRDNRSRRLPFVWVKHHDEFFKNTSLRNQAVDKTFGYAARDIFTEIVAPARKRGMKILCAGAGRNQPGPRDRELFEGRHDRSQRQVDRSGLLEPSGVYRLLDRDRRGHVPALRNRWPAMGRQSAGPLMNTIAPWNNNPAACFCEHCRTRAKAHGIDADRARQGYQELYDYTQALMAGNAQHADGVFVGFLRLLLRYPEILAWEYQYRLSREEVQKAIYDQVKKVKPTAQVGWHVDHQPSTWDLVYRAEMSYAEMAPYSDFIKIILYHDVAAPRVRNWYLERLRRGVLSEVPLDESLNLYYDLFGYDKTTEPKLSEMNSRGFSPEYVFRETKRSAASAAGKTKIYSGIGFNVPGSPRNTNPEDVYKAVLRAFDAGTRALWCRASMKKCACPVLTPSAARCGKLPANTAKRGHIIFAPRDLLFE